MRWFWQRRRQRQAAAEAPSLSASSTGAVQRAPTTSGRLGQPRQLNSEILVLARDYLQAVGAHVRVENEDVLSATLPEGKLVRYTTSLAKAHADESMTLLVEGSEALAAILDDIATRSRVTALRLTPAADPVALALDQGRLSLRWRTPGPLTARVVEQEESVAVEFAYLVAARDRQGRRDEWIRLAVDTATGQMIPALSDTALSSAQSAGVPADCERLLALARTSAERALREPLVASGIFLRQRSLDQYRRRLEEVATTFDRLQRESPEAARAAKIGRSRELSALSEVYAVDVEAQLESACVITSPCAVAAIRPAKGRGELLVHVDLGRQYVIPPDCATCGMGVRATYVCDAGHAVCARCAAACGRCGAWRCPACEEPELTACAKCGLPMLAAEGATDLLEDESPSAGGTLTVRHLDVLPPETWLTAIEWLLSCQGITSDSRRAVGTLAMVQGQAASGNVVAAAIRPDRQQTLDEATVRQAAAHLAPEKRSTVRMLFSTAHATDDAIQAAQQLGIQLLDRPALDHLLTGLASAHDRERERNREEMQARAEAAGAARQVMLDAVDAVDRALAPLRRVRRAAGRAATSGAAASRALAEVRAAIERASLAWETLLSDWSDAFGERPARNGNLLIQGEAGRFVEMGERATHLQTALLDALAMLAKTPAHGESGYTVWRQAVAEECAARGEAWRWRIRTYDPTIWSDFDRAWNAKAAAKAAEATTAAAHATARADKAQAQALRAG